MRMGWRKIFAALAISAIAATAFVFARSSANDLALKIPAPGDSGASFVLDARLFEPRGAGPFPAVVLMHGCSGWHGSNITDWASWFVKRGFVALMIDSFGQRGVKGVCGSPTKAHPTPRTRAQDAQGARDYLSQLPSVDARRLVLMGFSHGGTTAVVAAGADMGRDASASVLRFAAVVALYPWCGLGPGSFSEPVLPTLIVVGEKDDWTPAVLCLEREKAYETLGVHVVPGATHSFDLFRWKGEPVSSRNFRGHRLVPSRSATKEARKAVDEFLRARAL